MSSNLINEPIISKEELFSSKYTRNGWFTGEVVANLETVMVNSFEENLDYYQDLAFNIEGIYLEGMAYTLKSVLAGNPIIELTGQLVLED